MAGIKRRLAPDKGAARFGYVGAILLGGMEALFLRVICCALRNRHTLVSPTAIPCLATSAPRISCKVRSGCWRPAPIPPRGAPASVSGDRRPSRVLGHDPRLATAAPSESPCSRSPQTDPPLLAPMFPMLPPRPRDRVNPPNMVPAHRPPTICCLTTIADPHLLGNLLSGRIYPVGNRSSGQRLVVHD